MKRQKHRFLFCSVYDKILNVFHAAVSYSSSRFRELAIFHPVPCSRHAGGLRKTGEESGRSSHMLASTGGGTSVCLARRSPLLIIFESSFLYPAGCGRPSVLECAGSRRQGSPSGFASFCQPSSTRRSLHLSLITHLCSAPRTRRFCSKKCFCFWSTAQSHTARESPEVYQSHRSFIVGSNAAYIYRTQLNRC